MFARIINNEWNRDFIRSAPSADTITIQVGLKTFWAEGYGQKGYKLVKSIKFHPYSLHYDL